MFLQIILIICLKEIIQWIKNAIDVIYFRISYADDTVVLTVVSFFIMRNDYKAFREKMLVHLLSYSN